MPSCVELKGWSKYGEDHTKLPYSEALQLAEEVMAKLPDDIRPLVARPRVRSGIRSVAEVEWCTPAGPTGLLHRQHPSKMSKNGYVRPVCCKPFACECTYNSPTSIHCLRKNTF